MIRPARMSDTPRLVELLEYAHARSAYVGRCNVDAPYARKYLAGAIMRNGNVYQGGCLVMVAEDSDAVVQAFVFGSLERIYGVGDMLASFDHYLIATRTAPKGATAALFNAYVEWAAGNPRVLQIGGSHTDALPGSERMTGIFKRHGLRRCGALFIRDNDAKNQQETAESDRIAA